MIWIDRSNSISRKGITVTTNKITKIRNLKRNKGIRKTAAAKTGNQWMKPDHRSSDHQKWSFPGFHVRISGIRYKKYKFWMIYHDTQYNKNGIQSWHKAYILWSHIPLCVDPSPLQNQSIPDLKETKSERQKTGSIKENQWKMCCWCMKKPDESVEK